MVYNNFISRFIISVIFISVYTFIYIYDFSLIFYFIFFLYFLIFLEIILYFKKLKLIIILYLFISYLFVINIDLNIQNLFKFNLMILTVISFDVFSYITGKLLGKNKILKFISPNKTLEGLIGGILITLILAILLCFYINISINLNLILGLLFIIMLAFVGDIIESFFKRVNDIKNSSNFLPGHGGFFDRFDSLVFCFIFYPFYEYLIL